MGEMNNNGNEQDNDNFETYDNSTTVPLPSYDKKKNKNVITIAVASALLVCVVAGFLLKGYLSNQLMLLIKNPTEYYSYVENNSLSSGIDSLTKSYSTSINHYKKIFDEGYGLDFAMELSVSPEFAGLYGLTDIGSLKVNANVSYKDLKQQMKSEILYKDQSLAHFNYLSNLEEETYYLQVPELSNAYLFFSIYEMMEQSGISTEYDYSNNAALYQKLLTDGAISPEQLNQMLKKYTGVIVDTFKDVKQNSDTTLSISDASAKYTSLTVKIYAKDLYEISLNILNTAKEDTILRDMVVKTGLATEEDYIQGINDALLSLEDSKDSILSETDVVNMTVYVDSSGNIIGRDFTASDSTDAVGYYAIKKGTNIDFTAYYKQEGTTISDITGNATYSNGKLSGSATINVDDMNERFVATLDFKDLAISDDMQYLNGSMTLTSDTFNGVSVGLDLVGGPDRQDINLKMLYGNLEGFSLNIATKQTPFTEITLPTESDEIYNANTDLNSYTDSMDLDGFFNHIYDVTGIDLNSMFYGLNGY